MVKAEFQNWPNIKRVIQILICVSMILLTFGCEKQDNDSMTEKPDTKQDGFNTPDQTFIKVEINSIFEDDLKKSINDGDFRFIGVMGYALSVPGVPDYEEKYSSSYGIKIIEGTSDSYDNIADLSDNEFYRDYAIGYNTLLLRHITNE